MMRSTRYSTASLPTVATVSTTEGSVAALVRYRMMEGSTISHKVVMAAQNKSKSRMPLYRIRYGRNREIRVAFLVLESITMIPFFF